MRQLKKEKKKQALSAHISLSLIWLLYLEEALDNLPAPLSR